MKDKKRYWKGIEELNNDPEFVKHANKEFPDYLPINENKNDPESESNGSSRRDFLKMMGFGIAAATFASCEAPVRRAVPYIKKPVDVDPGIPNYYASTFNLGGDYCSVLVKTREGRPIKIKGNDASSLTRGGTSAHVEASVLSLYDQERLTGPYVNGEKTDWVTLDTEVQAKLEGIASRGGNIRIVSNSIISPSTKQVISEFQEGFPGTTHITYDPDSAYGIMEANNQTYGRRVVPDYNFDKADVIVNFGADFLGTWIAPVKFTKQYADSRKVSKQKRTMSRHYQFESNLSLAGANADYRGMIKASAEGLVVAKLYNILAGRLGATTIDVADAGDVKYLNKCAEDLLQARGSSLVISGSNDPAVQALINGINYMLDNYGNTIDMDAPLYTRQGNDQDMDNFVDELKQGQVNAVIFYNANPVYDHYRGAEIASALENVNLTVSTSDRMDETASSVSYVAPDHHFLESWNDAQPKKGFYSLGQPAISPLFNTRQAQESFLKWAGTSEPDFYNYLKNYWRANLNNNNGDFRSFDKYFDDCLYNGVLEYDQPETTSGSPLTFNANLAGIGNRINNNYQAGKEGLDLILYQKVGLRDGCQANNPWLQEMPDPISRATWDNYLTISQKMANEMGVSMNTHETKILKLTVNGQSMELPAMVQPGQAPGTVGLAVGYGRTKAGKAANGVGVNAFPLLTRINGAVSYNNIGEITVENTGRSYQLAQTQTHHTIMGRDAILQEATLGEYKENEEVNEYKPKIHTFQGTKPADELSMWEGHDHPNHHWGLVVDLNSCIGCGACTISCQAENNVPTVGRREVLNRREMHWIRIDRYYSSDADVDDWEKLEEAAVNPEVTFQPMMCQHCNNAPCETVCPVAATSHSSEGLNQMAYNRCVGTRFCANNCPYKVRRFNWFKYHDNDKFAEVNPSMNFDLGKMVLNPDVTVRSRGVMEKCTMCVQRIQYGKLEAKKEGRKVEDGEIETACAEACPADALTFGDMNDPDSRISQMLNDDQNGRAYHVLEEINTRPNVSYLTKVRNKDKQVAEENNNA